MTITKSGTDYSVSGSTTGEPDMVTVTKDDLNVLKGTLTILPGQFSGTIDGNIVSAGDTITFKASKGAQVSEAVTKTIPSA